VTTIIVLDDCDGIIISNYNKNYLLNVNSSLEVTFLGPHVMTMLGNIVTTLDE